MTFTILFLCTGNYYRSRFADILFNSLATTIRRPLHATSRGVATELGINNLGPISLHVRQRLKQLGINHDSASRLPLQVKEKDFQNANLIIALDEQEHRPMMRQRYPEWADRIDYWNIPDLWALSPDIALATIEQKVHELIDRLKDSCSASRQPRPIGQQ
jgi:protein-tyrosine phosphatase